jgi:hypothetical protein
MPPTCGASSCAALLQRLGLDERVDEGEQLLLGLGAQPLDLLETPFEARTQRCLGGPLGRLIREQASATTNAIGLAVEQARASSWYTCLSIPLGVRKQSGFR